MLRPMNVVRAVTLHVICCAAVAFLISASATGPVAFADTPVDQPTMEAYLPSDTNAVMSLDIEALMTLPSVSEAMERSKHDDMADFEARLERHGIAFQELFRRMVVFGTLNEEDEDASPRFGAVVRTAVEEPRLQAMLETESDNGELLYRAAPAAGRTVHFLEKKGEAPDADAVAVPIEVPQVMAVVYLDAHHMLITGEAHVEGMLGAIDAGRALHEPIARRVAGMDTDALVWAVYDNADPAGSMRGASFVMQAAGDGDDGVMTTSLVLESADEEGAMGTLLQLRMLVGSAPLIFEKDPGLAVKVGEAVTIAQDGPRVTLTVVFDRELIEGIQRFAEARRGR